MTGGQARARREIRAIATLETLDGLRSRRQLIVRTVTPIILFVCVLGITLALRGADQRNHPQAYRVAVEGDYEGAKTTLDALKPDRLVFFPASDARVATLSGAEAGMRVPDHLDETLTTRFDETAPIDLYESTVDPGSRAATVIIQSAFVDLHTTRVRTRVNEALQAEPSTGTAAGGTAAAPAPGGFSLEVTNVERTATGTRTLTSQVIPGLICLQAALLVTGTANRLVSRRTRGLLITQLLLPVSRRSLAIAKGLGELTIGFVTAAPVVLAVLAFGAIIDLRDGTIVDVAGHALASAIAMVALFAMTTTVGVVIGTAARTQEQVSLATGAAVIVAALVATVVALGAGTVPTAIAIVPFAGLVGMLREILNGSGSVIAFAVAVMSTLLGAFAFSALGGRSLDAERMVMRSA